jgi:anti-anti-sigma regulatory factor
VSKKKAARAPKPIRIDARVTIVQAAALHRLLLARLAGGGSIVIDGAAVEEIDTAVLQLLASLWRTGTERGVACSWDGVSDALRLTANLIGMTHLLHLPHAAA